MFLFNSFLTRNKSAFLAVGLASALMNILNLSGSLFMLEVYDRILPSKSIPSLVALVVLLIVLYAFLMGFDALRGRILARISDNMDDALNQKLASPFARFPTAKASSAYSRSTPRWSKALKSFAAVRFAARSSTTCATVAARLPVSLKTPVRAPAS